ncbi:Fe-S cluster assembly ATPase SufC, partial [Akkermansiaceae bacterium]|nr:Fe-S cluster assembly ATPase SufC [Akkermansiaceae bacterium]
MSLVIKDLHANVEDTPILKGVNLEIPKGEVHAIMGPNGSGKSTLSKVIAGHDDYEVTSGSVSLDGQDILELDVDERSRAGIFLAFQYPAEVPGVSNANFIRAALQARLPKGEEIDAVAYYKDLYSKMDVLEMNRKFTARAVNEGFSGGEKKRNEILQMMMLDPQYCILDETDSGLDIDALKIVAKGVNAMRSPDRGILMITHYQRLLDYIEP